METCEMIWNELNEHKIIKIEDNVMNAFIVFFKIWRTWNNLQNDILIMYNNYSHLNHINIIGQFVLLWIVLTIIKIVDL
jgi:hypothetical protein